MTAFQWDGRSEDKLLFQNKSLASWPPLYNPPASLFSFALFTFSERIFFFKAPSFLYFLIEFPLILYVIEMHLLVNTTDPRCSQVLVVRYVRTYSQFCLSHHSTLFLTFSFSISISMHVVVSFVFHPSAISSDPPEAPHWKNWKLRKHLPKSRWSPRE